MWTKPLAGIVSVAFVLAMGACGNDNGEENVGTKAERTATTAERTVSGPAKSTSGKDDKESTSGKKGTAPAETPEELAACLEKAGYAPTVIPAPPEGVPGSEFGSVGSVRIDVSPGNGVAAVFFENANKAKDIRKKFGKAGLAKRGTSERIGAVFLSANQGRPPQLRAFRTCLKG